MILVLLAGAGFGGERKWNEKEASFESVHPYPASSDDELEIREAGAA